MTNKKYRKITALENHFQATRTTRETNHHITQIIEVDLQNKEIHEISHKIDIVDQIVKLTNIEITIHDRIETQHNLFLHPVPIQTPGIGTIPTVGHETHRSYSNNRNQYYQHNRSTNNSYNKSNYQRPSNKYQNRSRNNSQNRNSR